MTNPMKQRSILPAWWWITLTGIWCWSMLLYCIPNVRELLTFSIPLGSGGLYHTNILSINNQILTIILLLLPLFSKTIHLNIPARIGLITYAVGYTINFLLFPIYCILDPERNFVEIFGIASSILSGLISFSWLLFVWSISAHWSLKVVLTIDRFLSLLISMFGVMLLINLEICWDYEEAYATQNLIYAINNFITFAATTLIVLVAQPKQPVPVADEQTQIG